jgi:hypothetical protein
VISLLSDLANNALGNIHLLYSVIKGQYYAEESALLMVAEMFGFHGVRARENGVSVPETLLIVTLMEQIYQRDSGDFFLPDRPINHAGLAKLEALVQEVDWTFGGHRSSSGTKKQAHQEETPWKHLD